MSTLIIPTDPDRRAKLYSETLGKRVSIELIRGSELFTIVFHWQDKHGRARAAVPGISSKMANELLANHESYDNPKCVNTSHDEAGSWSELDGSISKLVPASTKENKVK